MQTRHQQQPASHHNPSSESQTLSISNQSQQQRRPSSSHYSSHVHTMMPAVVKELCTLLSESASFVSLPLMWLVVNVQARFIHAEPCGVQLPSRHLYMMERLEDKVAAVNSRITAWRKWLTRALAAAPAAGQEGAGSRPKGLEVAPVGVPVQVCVLL